MIRVKLVYEREDYLNDVQDIPRAFSPYLVVDEEAEHFLQWDYSYQNGIFYLSVFGDIFEKKNYSFAVSDEDFSAYKRETRRFIKNSLYDYLSELLQIKLPYGSLTGVRPTKLYYELSEKMEYPISELVDNYGVSLKKANLIADCVKNQKNYINNDEKNIGFFINIPFCPTRCKYCSFISTEVFRVKDKLDFYVECVEKEIGTAFEIIAEKGYRVRSVYVGGGTPTSIGAARLRRILSPLVGIASEFTVEAGRPDAISAEDVEIMKELGVTRVSVNPQTFSDETLARIGRNHTVDDFYRAFDLMQKGGFDINTDLIAGLPTETQSVFASGVDKCIALAPANITVHTLSLKRGSDFTLSGMEKGEYGAVADMVDYAHNALAASGYAPYYMYRQKNMADNLENTGYALPGKQCVYNVDMMEEAATIIGVGAGSMTKRVSGGRIERLSDPKGFREYCERADDVCRKKKLFFGLES